MSVNHHANSKLITPHGGKLINRLVPEGEQAELRERATSAPQVHLSQVSLSDLELIATGVFSPLTGFQNSEDYRAVVHDMHLANGLPWTIPITLSADTERADTLKVGQDVALVDPSGDVVGLLELTEKYTYDRQIEAENVYRTVDTAHPGVERVYSQGDVYLAGPIWMFELPSPSFPHIYRTPQETRRVFAERGWKRVVAFQTRNPIHRAHEYLLKCALEVVDGLMLNPLVGATKADDVPAAVRVESYQVVLDNFFPSQRTLLTSFPAAMRYAGPREAIFHAICRKNYGCSHFIVGRDHAGVGGYYGTYDAQRIFDEFDPVQIAITPLFFEHAFHCHQCGHIVTAKTCPHDSSSWLHLSGTQVREKLSAGQLLPVEFTRPEVSEVLIRGVASMNNNRG